MIFICLNINSAVKITQNRKPINRVKHKINMDTTKILSASVASANSSYSYVAVTVPLILILIIFISIHLYYQSTESYKLGIQIPGPPPYPIIGNAHMAIGMTSHGKTNKYKKN